MSEETAPAEETPKGHIVPGGFYRIYSKYTQCKPMYMYIMYINILLSIRTTNIKISVSLSGKPG